MEDPMDLNGMSPQQREKIIRGLLAQFPPMEQPQAPETPRMPPAGVRQLRAFRVDLGTQSATEEDVEGINKWLRGRPAAAIAHPVIVQADEALTVLFFFDEPGRPGEDEGR